MDTQSWDFVLDSSGNWAVANAPYSVAQDVAAACRLFLGELWYDTSQGIPYFGQILGQRPSLGFVKAQLVAAALTVPGVTSAKAFITKVVNRELFGQVQVTTEAGTFTIAMAGASPWYVSGYSPTEPN